MKTLPRIAILIVAAALAAPLAAQETSADANMQILREKVKADKKLIVAANMKLSDAQAKAFWPIYDAYQKDLEALQQRGAKLIASYADAYNRNAITDDVARKLTGEMVAIEIAEANMRKTYADRVSKAVSPTAAARYLQIENKIRAIIRYELAANIPLVP